MLLRELLQTVLQESVIVSLRLSRARINVGDLRFKHKPDLSSPAHASVRPGRHASSHLECVNEFLHFSGVFL